MHVVMKALMADLAPVDCKCSGSEAGSYSRLIDCVSHSTLGLSVIKKTKKKVNRFTKRHPPHGS